MLPALRPEQVTDLQSKLRHHGLQRRGEPSPDAVASNFERTYNLAWRGHGDTVERVGEIQSRAARRPPGPNEITVDTAALLAPNVAPAEAQRRGRDALPRVECWPGHRDARDDLDDRKDPDEPAVVQLPLGGSTLKHVAGR